LRRIFASALLLTSAVLATHCSDDDPRGGENGGAVAAGVTAAGGGAGTPASAGSAPQNAAGAGGAATTASPTTVGDSGMAPATTGAADRAYNVQVLVRIAGPVLEALSRGEFKQQFPVHDWERERAAFTHYEAFARTLAGIAPWLELGPDDTAEGQERARFIELAHAAIVNATDPGSPDFLNFGGDEGDQPLVEAAYFSSALMLAPSQLWEPLTEGERANVLDALRAGRAIENTHDNNWILFPAMIEAALWTFTGEVDMGPIRDAVETFRDEWYLGDGVYGDGPLFHWDWYNSYAIHPFMLQVLRVAEENDDSLADDARGDTMARALRYAEVLERLISPEGTFPVIGRSSAYRFGAFYHLAYMALRRDLPEEVNPAGARGGMTAVVRRMVEAPGTFDEGGWLQLGAVGRQPSLQETYNASGSLYIALLGLVHLGLPASDELWTAPAAPWTQRRIWAGEDIPRDESLE
jgi:hypothetical protein